MLVQSTLLDCLFLNWAVPVKALPAPPRPLAYDSHRLPDGNDVVLASLVMFRHSGLEIDVPLVPAVDHPQCNLRVCVRDEDGEPAVLFLATLAPWWVLPPARLLAGHRFAGAALDFARPSSCPDAESWRFSVVRGDQLAVTVRRGSPVLPPPAFGGLDQLVRFLRQRPRGFVPTRLGLQQLESSPTTAPVWPLIAEVACQDLLDRLQPLVGGVRWPALHSAFLLAEVEMAVQLLPVRLAPLPRQIAAAG